MTTAAEISQVDLTKMPEDVREKLAELDLELAEGECVFSFRTCIPGSR